MLRSSGRQLPPPARTLRPLVSDAQGAASISPSVPTTTSRRPPCFSDALHRKNDALPAVCWIVPNNEVSEHPPASVRVGQAYVTKLINAVMSGPQWSESAIFLAWDDWGGFYDHVPPPNVDGAGHGIRVPGLAIGPYAKKGTIDHQVLSFDVYPKFIEDLFLNGQRLDPKTDGRPDARRNVRENVPTLGDLLADFDFTQAPRPPLILRPNP